MHTKDDSPNSAPRGRRRRRAARSDNPNPGRPGNDPKPSKKNTAKVLLTLSGVLLFGAVVIAAAAFYARPVDAPGAQAAAANPASLVRFHSPTKGEATAKVHIVEFLDPACETCSRFYPFVSEFMHANPGRVRVTLRYAPFHPGSEDVVRLLEAARKQGKFWETLEALLQSQPKWVINHTARLDLARDVIRGVGLQMDRVEQDMRAPEVSQVIQQDIQDAVGLNVTKTPEFFVNGRPMPSFGFEQLRTLVDQALRESYG